MSKKIESMRVESLRGNDQEQTLKGVKKKKRKKMLKIILAIVVVLIAIIGYFIWDVFSRVSDMFDEVYTPVETEEMREPDQELVLGEDPFSILILGHDGGRSNTIMVATVNPNLGYTYLVSIPRDTYAYLVGHGHRTRLGHAHSYGGVEMVVNTIQRFLDIPLDYFVTISDAGFPDLVDAVGGVRVYNDTMAWHCWRSGNDFTLGYMDLDGTQAFHFAQMRWYDSDYGRQHRNRLVLEALLSEMAGVSVITRYQEVLEAAGRHLQTDVSLSDMFTISTRYTSALNNLVPLQLQGYGQMINGMSLQVVPESYRLEMSRRLREHLELD